MKRIILFVLILFTIKSAYSQTNKEVDSIWLLVNSLEGKEQINEMVMLCEALWNVDFDSALHIGELALAKSKEIDYEEGYVFALGDIAGTYFKKGNYAQSLNYYNQSLIYFEKNNRADKQAIIYSNIGNVYFTIGNSELALENYLKTMTIYEELNDTAGIAQSYNNIAFLYKSRDQFEEALKYYDKALELARIIDDKLSMSYILNNVGILYSNIGDKGKALETYLESLSIKVGIQDGPMSKVISLNNIGLIYLNFKDYQLA